MGGGKMHAKKGGVPQRSTTRGGKKERGGDKRRKD